MANHKSAVKRARQAKKRNIRNTGNISAMKTFIKKFNAAAAEKNVEKAQELFQFNVAFIMKLSSKKIIHKNNAARKISKLAKLYNSVKVTAAS